MRVWAVDVVEVDVGLQLFPPSPLSIKNLRVQNSAAHCAAWLTEELCNEWKMFVAEMNKWAVGFLKPAEIFH